MHWFFQMTLQRRIRVYDLDLYIAAIKRKRCGIPARLHGGPFEELGHVRFVQFVHTYSHRWTRTRTTPVP